MGVNKFDGERVTHPAITVVPGSQQQVAGQLYQLQIRTCQLFWSYMPICFYVTKLKKGTHFFYKIVNPTPSKIFSEEPLSADKMWNWLFLTELKSQN